jgi:hypothetical protein
MGLAQAQAASAMPVLAAKAVVAAEACGLFP